MTKRKKEKEVKRNTIICLRLTDYELDLLDAACTNTGMSRSDYIRNLINANKLHIHFDVVADIEPLRLLVAEYGKIGSNLNQIARHFNSGGENSLELEDEIRQCIADLFVLRKKVLELAGEWNGNVKTYKK